MSIKSWSAYETFRCCRFVGGRNSWSTSCCLEVTSITIWSVAEAERHTALEGLHLLLGIILDHQSMSFVDICCLLATHLGGETRFTPLFTPLLKFHELPKMSMFSQVSFPASRRRIAAYDASKGLFHMANLVPAMYHRDIKPLNIVLDKPHPQNPVQGNWFHCEFLVKNPRHLCFLLWKNRRKGTAKMVDFGVQDPT